MKSCKDKLFIKLFQKKFLGKGDTKDSLHTSQTGKAKSALKQKKNANPY